jgi:hypothetical protein
MFCVIAKFIGNCHGFLGIWVDKVSMASFAAAIHKPSPFQFGYRVPYFWRYELNPVLSVRVLRNDWLEHHALI